MRWGCRRGKSSVWRFAAQRPCPAEELKPTGPGFLECLYTTIAGCTCRQHIVDQYDFSARNPLHPNRIHPECLANRFLPLLARQPAHARRALRAQQQVGAIGHATQPREFLRDQCRLVEAARPKARPVERHRRYDDLTPVIGQIADQLPRDQFGEAYLAAIFEAQDNLARYIIIGDSRPYAVVQRLFGQTFCTQCARFLFVSERPRTTCAPRRIQKAQLRPAASTKLGAIGRNCSTRRTAFRQRKIERGPDDLAKQ